MLPTKNWAPGINRAMRDCLEQADVPRMVRIWDHLYPGIPMPKDPEHQLIALHHARTASESLPLEKRLYSHAFLAERNAKSALPDELRPPAERVGSTIVAAVGIALVTASRFPDRQEEARHIEGLMARAAGDLVRVGITDRARISARMWEVREQYRRGLLRREI